MESESEITEIKSEVPESITIKDVLRAVFLPPRDAEPLALPHIPQPRFQISTSDKVDEASQPDLQDLSGPTAIVYEETPIEPIDSPAPSRIISLGMGSVITILIAYLAQSSLTNAGNRFAGGLLFTLAGLVWLGLLMFEFAPPDGGVLRRGPRITGSGAARPLDRALDFFDVNTRILLTAVALTLSTMTYFLTAGNTFTLASVIAWALSVIAWMLVAAERDPLTLFEDAREALGDRLRSLWPPKVRVIPLVAFVLIMAVAVFFRFYRLEAIPNEMTSDHVEKLLDSYDVSQGIYHVFFTRNGGREAIQFYLVALASKLFGTGMSLLTLKIVSALEALALIPLMVVLGRELVDKETGYYAAALVAISWWHTSLARLALRIVLTPLMFTLVVIVLIRGIRTGSRKAWVWAGLWMGVGVYAYQSMRIVPLVAIAAVLVAVLGPVVKAVIAHIRRSDEASTRRMIAGNVMGRQSLNLALAGVIALAMFVPMLRVWHDFPDELWNRVINRTTGSEVEIQGEPGQVLVQNYFDAIRMYNVEGDHAWISTLPGAPMLDLVTGGLFVMGLVAWLVRLRIRRDPVDSLVPLAILVMLLPSALAIAFPIENPSATRASGTLPFVFVLAAWPLALIRQRWSLVFGRRAGTLLSAALILALMFVAGVTNYDTYFVKFAESYRESALNPGEVAAAVREEIGEDAPLDGVWLQGWPFWHDYRAIGIEMGDITFNQAIIDVPTLQSYLETFPATFEVRPLVFIVHPDDNEGLAVLEEAFPTGNAKLYPSETTGRDFILFVVE
jgi:hypothetical protein